MSLCSPFSPTLITLLFSPFTDNFLFIHTLLNTVTNLCKLSFDSPNRTVSSANNSTFTLHTPPPLILFKLKPSSPHSLLTSLTTLSLYRLNNQGDITHPCHNPTFTSNISPLTPSTRTHALTHTRSAIKIKSFHCIK